MKSKIYLWSKNYGQKAGLDLPYFVKNGFWITSRLTIVTLLTLILYMVFTRFVSEEIFGQYQFIISILAIVYVFSHPGLNTSLLRSVSRGYDGDYTFAVKKSFQTSFLGIPVLLALGAYYYFSNQVTLGIALMISSVFFPFLYAPNTWGWFLQGKHKFNVLMRYSTVQYFFTTLATILIIFLKKESLVWIMVVYLISYTFFTGFYYFKSLRYIENEKKDTDFLSYGRFLTKINILVVMADNIDKILVGILLGPVNLAIYVVATFLVIRINESLKGLMSIFSPKMANLKISFYEFVTLHKYRIILMSFFLLVLSIGYYIVIPFLNKIMFTSRYSEFSYISQIFSITVFLSIPIGILGYYINARKNEFAIMLTNPIFSLIKIALNVYLIWNFKLVGAAIAFNVSMILWVGLHLYGIFNEESKFYGAYKM